MNPHYQPSAVLLQQADRMDRDRARVALDYLPFSGQFIQSLAVLLERRIHWWYLQTVAFEPSDNLFPGLQFQIRHFCSRVYRSVSIAGIGGLAELRGYPVDLVRRQQIGVTRSVFSDVGVVDPVRLGQEVLLERVRLRRFGDVADVDASLIVASLGGIAVSVQPRQRDSTTLVRRVEDVT